MLALIPKSNYIADFYKKNTLSSDFHVTDDISKNLLIAVSPFMTHFQ